ncbi:MAG: molybdopterin molybdotransferase MoeA [Bryobacterales bacterium]|nr:molybdopterin molybdotransferase MoeA [Bryobacteraceae bacterium]MDW8130448.1 molybdopterin molybdotransferase MoeA [Bryobacterales bacterium]
MASVPVLSFWEARRCVIEQVKGARRLPAIEKVDLEDAAGRVLAEDLHADRDYPPCDRSLRDGYALRAADTPGRLRVAGEVRAGAIFPRPLASGEAVEIMTGAPLPEGADAVAMREQVRADGEWITLETPVASNRWVEPRAAQAHRGQLLLAAGRRIGFVEIALLATLGRRRVSVYRRPRVAVLATGDEIVELDRTPLGHQVRNSNAWSLAAQIRRAGGTPELLPVAPDQLAATCELMARGLETDLLVISGGVSAGKYDLVEPAACALGAEFFFTGVEMQPGYPLVFGRARGTFFFGLPGNPVCTMVAFEVFARAALGLLGGEREPLLPILEAPLVAPFRHQPGVTRLAPARLVADGGAVMPLPWRGSGDIFSLVHADAFVIADADRECWQPGERMRVLLR